MSLKDKLDQAAEAKIRENWPKVQQAFQEKVGPAALAAAKDDDKMRSLFKLVYEAMPFPVRMMVKEDAFLQFCFAHRDEFTRGSEAGGPKA